MCESSCRPLIINGITYLPQSKDGDIKIMILQAGFVYVGYVNRDGDNMVITSAYNVRRYGTTEGIGQIALHGPTKDTKLDYYGTVRCHYLNVVNEIDCNQDNWASIVKGKWNE